MDPTVEIAKLRGLQDRVRRTKGASARLKLWRKIHKLGKRLRDAGVL